MHDEEYPCKGCLASNPFPRYSGQFNGHLLFNTDLEELHQYLLCERIEYRETVEVTNKTADKSLVSVEAGYSSPIVGLSLICLNIRAISIRSSSVRDTAYSQV
jgi:hypothetical protein